MHIGNLQNTKPSSTIVELHSTEHVDPMWLS